MRRILSFFLAGIFALALSAAKAPTDEQLKALCRDAGFAMQNAQTAEARQQAFDAVAGKLTQQADLQKITAQQVDLVFDLGGVTLQPYLSQWLASTLEAKAAREGGMFSFLCWKYMPREDMFHISEHEVQVLRRFLDDSNLSKIVEQGEVARDIINGLSSFKYANWNQEGMIKSTLNFLSAKTMPQPAVLECVKVFNAAMLADSLSADDHEQIRKAVLAQYQRLEKNAPSARIQKSCQEQITYLEGPFAKGTLVGSKAPELHFLRWYGHEGDSVVTRDIQSLHALHAEGKSPVVMLDFWGTKCVPCIQSFPELAEMQQQLMGKDVIVIGITSLQGYFVDTPNHRTIQTRNNPEKELGLFPALMKDMGINWNIAITEEDVMNTDYGVLAIPHVVLIDKQGRVRYNALGAEKEERLRIIEQLLAE